MTDPNCIRLFADEALIKECKGKLKSAEASFNILSQILSLAGNEVRLKILYLLEEEDGGLCVCDLADILEMSIPAVSQHLRKLKDANIIKPHRQGQTIFYSFKQEHLEIIRPLFQHITMVTAKRQKV
ncbi:metalloregulator ArsR/SmtB family transcription factor [Daejeonella sp.]|uniref:ArsR/SmtB family transcription factor n=1 Tax=Daejeonella sp. TaxID=2805397 RepID=UPI0030BC6788